MSSFSLRVTEPGYLMDSYKTWLEQDVYSKYGSENIDDPNFLQKLSILQAENVRQNLSEHAFNVDAKLREEGAATRRRIQSAANIISSTLDEGFMHMNKSLANVNDNLYTINSNINGVSETLQHGAQILGDLNDGVARTNQGIGEMNIKVGAIAYGLRGMNANMVASLKAIQGMNDNIAASFQALQGNISQGLNILTYRFQLLEATLEGILQELHIPESQRERRYHIQEGIKFFNKGIQSGKCLYFDDAKEEFEKAIQIERKDFFSWYYLGMIHLYAKNYLDIKCALEAFERYEHYADALTERHFLYDEMLMMKSECYYLQMNLDEAAKTLSPIVAQNSKAALRTVKYLSATREADKAIEALKIFKGLFDKNPYISMQVLEDSDILYNDHIIQFLQEYRSKLLKDVIEFCGPEGKMYEHLGLIELYRLLPNLISEVQKKKEERIKKEEEERKRREEEKERMKKEEEERVKKVEEERKKIEEDEQKIKAEEDRIKNNPQMIDLGLPSGTLWADRNIGAESPEKGGVYFAWGEIRPKKALVDYTWPNYKFCKDTFFFRAVSKYDDDKIKLERIDDAAANNWGGDWRMPTMKQWRELSQYTTLKKISKYNNKRVKGWILTSKINGLSIFFPDIYVLDYWSADRWKDNSTYANCIHFEQGRIHFLYEVKRRSNGLNIRAVCSTRNNK